MLFSVIGFAIPFQTRSGRVGVPPPVCLFFAFSDNFINFTIFVSMAIRRPVRNSESFAAALGAAGLAAGEGHAARG